MRSSFLFLDFVLLIYDSEFLLFISKDYLSLNRIYIFLGKSMPTNKNGSIVSFAISQNDLSANARTNDRYDELLEQLRRNEDQLSKLSDRRGRRAFKEAHKNEVKGVKGPCVLRKLPKFDVGQSFLVDSLHNVYLGLFVSL